MKICKSGCFAFPGLVLIVCGFVALPTQSTWSQESSPDAELQQENTSQTGVERRQQRRDDRRDRRGDAAGGAAAGALAGAALGAMVGEPGIGAAYGATAGGLYSYDQSRQDDRTQMIADAIATGNQTDPTQAAANQTVSPQSTVQSQATVGDVGKRHMQDFVGDWNLEMWVLAADGSRLTGSGRAKGLSTGENSTRVLITELSAEAFPEAQGGTQILLSYKPGQGFFLESDSPTLDEKLQMVGEYLADSNEYEFYLVGKGAGDEMVGGVLRSSVKIRIRSTGTAMWVAETYTYLDGKETQVQSYRFVRN